MKQYTGNQYDDDLTVGTEDYDDSYYTGSVDFFEFATDDESPISRLKSLILSIDWEITDDILMQFNEELIDLRDIWAGEKINLVYVQALEKISKYIYQKKANSHPSAIKLLLTLYHNLEKIVSSYDLTEEQKKEILLEDVKRFESLKKHIGQHSQVADIEMRSEQLKQQNNVEHISSGKDLLTLKAIVLGIDWEITDQDLNALRQEVVRLDEKFAGSRPKLILLQGIGTLAAYIKLKKSNAHADAFKLLHLFYDSLEKIVATPMKLEEEKAILLPAVEKFNAFKSLLGPTIAAESISRDEEETEDREMSSDSITLAPAFADIPEEDVKGFQAEEEAQALGLESSGNIDNHVESFFMGESFKNLEAENYPGALSATDGEMQKIALQGANVEIDDDEEPDGVLFAGGHPAPALSGVIEEEKEIELPPGLEVESSPVEDELALEETVDWPAEDIGATNVGAEAEEGDSEQTGLDFSKLDRDLVLQGVDVETEADDDSDEEALPLMGGQLAPALAANDEVSLFNAAIFEESSSVDSVDEDIAGTLDGFFDDEIASHFSSTSTGDKENDQITSLPVDVEIGEKPNELDDVERLDVLNADKDLGQNSAEGLVTDNSAMSAEDEQDTDSAEINDRLDSFFDLEEGVIQADGDVFLDTEPEMTAGSAPAEENIVPPPVAEEVEEEVVFELVEEETHPAGSTLDPGTMNLPDSADHSDMFQSLQSCVDALGVELDERVIASLWQEINTLYRNLPDKPLEKTFLQLLSTVTRYIDQNRYDSGTEAYKLLQSICAVLGTLQDDTLLYNQEMLLVETHKVLIWQEQIFQELVAKNEAELTISDEEVSPEALMEGEKIAGEGEGIHQEISTLRQTLQDEIAALRKELRDS